MVQRLGLAVAMLADAPVMLLDEPTAALDPDGLAAFYSLVERRRENRGTLLFTSHQLGDAERLADRFAILVAGRLVVELTYADLHERLSVRGVMSLRLGPLEANVRDAVTRAVPGATWRGEELVVAGPPAGRPGVIDAVRSAGAEIRNLSTQEARLDELYRELTGERP
jgi:Cu-processing system ATP-binding protein